MTDQIYIAVGKNTAERFDKLDDGNLETGAFRRADFTENASYIGKELGVFAINPDDPGFESFRTQLLTGYRAQREALEKTPIAVSLYNAIFLMENPNVFQITIPSNAEIAGELKEIFPTSAKSGGKYPGTDYEKITLRFDRRDIKPEQRAELKAFVEKMRPKSLPEILQRGGIGYLNLLIFAGSVAKQSVPEQKPSSPPPEPTGPQPLVPDEPRHMFCTSEGASPAGETKPAVSGTEPILEHFGESDVGRPDVIYMPLRKTHFQLNMDEPVDKKEFERTIAQMVDDLYEITSGDFAKTCGIHRLRDFDDELTIYFVGMADPIGDPERNQQLSEDRARVVAEEFVKQLHERNKTTPLKTNHGIRVVYAGVGEQGEEEVNPELRQTRALIMSSGSPSYWVEKWKEVEGGRIAGDPTLKRIQLEDHCIGQPEGCEELLQDCIDSAILLCSQMPYHDQQACEEKLTKQVWTLEDIQTMDPQMAYWLSLWSGHPLGLRFLHNMKTRNGTEAHESLLTESLEKCFREARYSLDSSGPHYPRNWKLYSPNITREIPMERLGNLYIPDFYCAEGTAAVDAKGCRLSREPVGYVVRCGTKKIATLGKDQVSFIYKDKDDSFFSFLWRKDKIIHFPPFRSFIINENGETPNFDKVVRQIVNDVWSAINGGRFFKRCYNTKATKLRINFYYTENPFDPSYKYEIERQKDYIISEVKTWLRREFGHQVELVFEEARFTNNSSLFPNDSVNVSVGVPPEGESDAIDGWDFLFSYSGYAPQAGSSTGEAGQIRVDTPDN